MNRSRTRAVAAVITVLAILPAGALSATAAQAYTPQPWAPEVPVLPGHVATPRVPWSFPITYPALPSPVLPTCATIQTATSRAYLAEQGMGAPVDTTASGVRGTSLPALVSVIAANRSVSCTWTNKRTGRKLTTTVTQIGVAERDLVDATLLAAGYPHSEPAGDFYNYEYTGKGPHYAESHLLALDGLQVGEDFWVVTRDSSLGWAGAYTQSASEAVWVLNN
jgi:hypothetical protein